MLPTKIYTLTIAANQSQNLLVNGQFFKLLSVTGAVTIESSFGKLEGLISGQGLENTPFNTLLLTDASGASNTIKILIGDENFIDGFTGNIAITANKVAQSSSYTNTARTVTNASAQMIAANAARQYLLIQNKDGGGNIFINFGSAATLANGIRIVPGGNFESNEVTSTQAIFAIGDQASNANILTVEG